MSWFLAIALALAAFAALAFGMRVPRPAWATLAAALAFGLAGYALQASPGLAGAPAATSGEKETDGSGLVEARRRIMGLTDKPTPPYIITSDAFARHGQYQEAAGLLRGAVRDHPGDAEAWVALGNALVEHSDGTLNPAALYAYRRADAIDPESAGPVFFLGLALIRQGALVEAHQMWSEQLARMPEGAPGRDELAQRFGLLDEGMRRIAAEAPAEPSAP